MRTTTTGRLPNSKKKVKRLQWRVIQNRWNIRSNKRKIGANTTSIGANAAGIQSNTDKSAANMADILDSAAAIQDNAADIAGNLEQLQGARTDLIGLEECVSDLEAAPPGSGDDGSRDFVLVDCNLNPNALLDPPINGYFPDNTTYGLVGRCNGPLYVTEDEVYFEGNSPDAAIVLPPGDATAASNGAVFGDGAHNLQIRNLTIDALAWNSVVNEGTESAGVYARNAFVRVIDSDILGGEYGINPFRDAVVRLQGTVNVTDFLNVGISAGDHSLVTTRGQVNIATSITEGNFIIGLELYRGGNMDFRRGVTVSLPPGDQFPFPRAVAASNNSHLRIRQSGQVNIGGNASMRSNSTLAMLGGILAGNLDLEQGSSAQLFGVIQNQGSNLFSGNSNLQSFDSTLANTNVTEGSVAKLSGGELDGAIVQLNGFLSVQQGVSVTNLISASKPSVVDINDTNMNGNPLFFCDEDTAFFDASVTNPIDTCP